MHMLDFSKSKVHRVPNLSCLVLFISRFLVFEIYLQVRFLDPGILCYTLSILHQRLGCLQLLNDDRVILLMGITTNALMEFPEFVLQTEKFSFLA